MKKFVIQAIILIVAIFGGLYFTTSRVPGLFKTGQQSPASGQNPTTRQLVINSFNINVEIADTPPKRSQGLGGRDNLATNSGMLFTFPKEDKHSFWMKGMRFPLDFIWIRQMKVVDIIKNAQPPQQSQTDETLPIYVPNQPVDSMLEVNSGFVDQHGLKVGDNIELGTKI